MKYRANLNRFIAMSHYVAIVLCLSCAGLTYACPPVLTDECLNDPYKTEEGVCGCGVPDTDSDLDGVKDCHDNCLGIYDQDQTDSDGDGHGDKCDCDLNQIQATLVLPTDDVKAKIKKVLDKIPAGTFKVSNLDASVQATKANCCKWNDSFWMGIDEHIQDGSENYSGTVAIKLSGEGPVPGSGYMLSKLYQDDDGNLWSVLAEIGLVWYTDAGVMATIGYRKNLCADTPTDCTYFSANLSGAPGIKLTTAVAACVPSPLCFNLNITPLSASCGLDASIWKSVQLCSDASVHMSGTVGPVTLGGSISILGCPPWSVSATLWQGATISDQDQ